MNRTNAIAALSAVLVVLAAGPARAQGPGSCGFHLDLITNDTSTHAAVADLPGGPGSGVTGLPPGTPGNPYCAYAAPGSTFRVRLTVPGTSLGPAPFGPGSLVTILWATATIPFPMTPPAGVSTAPCTTGQAWIVSALPWGGAIVDGIGLTGPPPTTPPVIPSMPDRFEVTLRYPGVGTPVHFQAVLFTPTGRLAVSNGASLLTGPSPHQLSLLPTLVPCGGASPLDEGRALFDLPAGFAFYGVPVARAHAHTNGFIDFLPTGAWTCDPVGAPDDIGCAAAGPETSPRIAPNHFDATFAGALPAPLVADLTVETAPPGGGLPARKIVRWKNAMLSGGPAYPAFPDRDRASMVCELWGDGRLLVVRQDLHAVTDTSVHGFLGMGPGGPGQGFGGFPSSCLSVSAPALWGGSGTSFFTPAIYQLRTALGPSLNLTNLAAVFSTTPAPGYTLKVY
jgi:hypothetical protein